MKTIGSLCAGIGGLDLAIEARSEARVAWQADLVGEDIRARHWPDATQLVGDIREMPLSTFTPVDVLAAGFPCQGLSQAGKGKGLEDHRSALFYRVLEIAQYLEPEEVILENVPRLLARHREEVELCFQELGYGCTWVPLAACEAGAPHRRRRVFVVARRRSDHQVLPATRIPRALRLWPTATAANPNEHEPIDKWLARRERVRQYSRPISPPLGVAVRMWPTATAGDAKASGSRSLSSSKAHAGTSLTDAVRPDRTTASGVALAPGSGIAGVLNPQWVASLMGFPSTWLDPHGESLHGQALGLAREPRWPAPRVDGQDGASPQHDWEAPRLLPKTRRYPGRGARLKAIGNSVCPAQGLLALQRADKSL